MAADWMYIAVDAVVLLQTLIPFLYTHSCVSFWQEIHIVLVREHHRVSCVWPSVYTIASNCQTNL